MNYGINIQPNSTTEIKYIENSKQKIISAEVAFRNVSSNRFNCVLNTINIIDVELGECVAL